MNVNEKLTQLFLNSTTTNENNSGYYTFPKEIYPQVFELVQPMIQNSETVFSFDLKKNFPETNFQFFHLDNCIEEQRYMRQGGGDFYSYIKIQIQAIPEPIVLIKEDLPIYLRELLGPPTTKNNCIELMQVYPYILKAIFDDCIQSKVVGISFNILDLKFHPVDYKPFTYYICCKKLLDKLKKG